MKRKFIFWLLVGVLILFLFAISSCNEENYFNNEKYIVVEKGPDLGSQYFLIRTIPFSKVMVSYDTINNIKNTVIITKNSDTLYTLLTPTNYMYQKYMEWDQMSYSYNVGDTIVIKSLSKDKFWKRQK